MKNNSNNNAVINNNCVKTPRPYFDLSNSHGYAPPKNLQALPQLVSDLAEEFNFQDT